MCMWSHVRACMCVCVYWHGATDFRHAECCLLQCFLFLQVSANGNVLKSEIVGNVKLKVVLSGMPELRLGLNDKVLFEISGSK